MRSSARSTGNNNVFIVNYFGERGGTRTRDRRIKSAQQAPQLAIPCGKQWAVARARVHWIAPDVRSSVPDLVSDKHNQKLGKFPARCVAPSFGERGSVQLPSSPFERSEDGVAQVYPTHSE